MYLDPISVRKLSADAINTTALNITWDPPAIGGASSYEVSVVASDGGASGNNRESVNISENSYIWGKLTAGTKYNVQVYPIFAGRKSTLESLTNVPTSKS